MKAGSIGRRELRNSDNGPYLSEQQQDVYSTVTVIADHIIVVLDVVHIDDDVFIVVESGSGSHGGDGCNGSNGGSGGMVPRMLFIRAPNII